MRDATAYHEAGHVVARFAFALPVSSASIAPDGDSLGHVRHRNMPESLYNAFEYGTPTASQERRLEHELIATLAGPAAEKRHTGRRNNTGAASDHAWVAEWTTRVASPRVANAWLRYLEARADDVIDGRWNTVEAVADELIDHITIAREDLLRILRSRVRAREPPSAIR